MLIYSILFLLLSNAISSTSSESISCEHTSSEAISSQAISEDLEDKTKRWDKSILYSRVTIIILIYSTLLSGVNIYIEALNSGIAIYDGLFHLTSTSQIFQIFIYLLSAAILQLTAFYPRRVWVGGAFYNK